MAADTSSLSRKTARSPEGNVDVEPPGSLDDSSMILIEIGVDVGQGRQRNGLCFLISEIKYIVMDHSTC